MREIGEYLEQAFQLLKKHEREPVDLPTVPVKIKELIDIQWRLWKIRDIERDVYLVLYTEEEFLVWLEKGDIVF